MVGIATLPLFILHVSFEKSKAIFYKHQKIYRFNAAEFCLHKTCTFVDISLTLLRNTSKLQWEACQTITIYGRWLDEYKSPATDINHMHTFVRVAYYSSHIIRWPKKLVPSVEKEDEERVDVMLKGKRRQ